MPEVAWSIDPYWLVKEGRELSSFLRVDMGFPTVEVALTFLDNWANNGIGRTLAEYFIKKRFTPEMTAYLVGQWKLEAVKGMQFSRGFRT